MRTPGTTGNGVTLETGISGASVPRSVLYGMRGISGVVSWSWMDETAFTWNGWYGTPSGDISSASANSFDGALVLSGGALVNGVYRYVASHESATSLQGRVFGGSSAVDTSALVPTISSRITLGWANRSADDNPAVADFEFFAVFNRSLSSSDQSALLANPWQLFAPLRLPVVFLGPSTGAGITVAVPVGAVSVAGYAPTVTTTANQTISVPVGAVSLTGYAPTVNTSASQTIAVPAGAVSLTGYAPSVFTTAVTTIAVPSGAVSLAGFAPSVSYTTHAYIDVPKGAVTLTGYAPTVTGGESSIWTPITTDSAVWSAQSVSAATWTPQ